MATLFNTKISETYEGLLKTIDNAAISATLKELTDGSGNQSGLYLNTAGDFKVSNILEWGSLKDTGTGVTITRYVTSTDGLENFDNNTSLPTSAAVKLYVDTKFATSDTLQEVLIFGNTTGGNDIVVSASDDITFTDTSKAIFGAGSDLQIYHDGSNSYIKDTGTGNLVLDTNGTQISLGGNGETFGVFRKDASVELYYNNAKKFETTDTGVTITGRLSGLTDPTLAQDAATKSYVDGLDAGSDLDITDGTTAGAVNLNTQSLSILGTTNEIETVVSGQGVTIGLPSSISTDLVGNVTGNVTGNVAGDLTGNVTATSILANGVTATTQASSDDSTKVATTAYVKGLDNASDLDFSGDSGSGDVNLNTQALAITGTANQIESTASNQGLSLQFPSAGVTLPNGSSATTQSAGNNSTKVATTSYVDTSASLYLPLSGGTMSGSTTHNDNVKSVYGTGGDAQVYHDGSNFYANNTTGQLNIDQAAVTESIVFKTSDANALDTTALIISRNGDMVTGRDVTIAGDLTVNGTTTTVNSQTLSVDDPLISLAINNAANSLDIGYYGKYNDGTTRYLGLFNDASDSNKFKLFKGTTVEPTTTVNVGAAGYEAADLELANLVTTANVNVGTNATFVDNGKAIFGAESDLQIYHDGSNSYMETSTASAGDLYIKATGTGHDLYLRATDDIFLQPQGGENGIAITGNGGVNLYFDSVSKFITTGLGVEARGEIDVVTDDNLRVRFFNGTAFKAGLEVATTAGDLIAGSAVDDYCIRSQANILISSGGNVERLRIDSSGNVGIGTDSPSRLLDVDGIQGWSLNDAEVAYLNPTSTGTDFALKQSGVNVIRLDGRTNANSYFNAGGNVGIGTTSPDATLHISKNAIGDYLKIGGDDVDSNRGLLFTSSTTISTGDTHTINARSGNGVIALATGSVERMRISSDGKVGIGTNSPSAKLHVDGGTSSEVLKIEADTDPYIRWVENGTNVGFLQFKGDGTAYLSNQSNGTFFFRTNNTNKMSITGAGNVGIGTDSPVTKLMLEHNNDGAVGGTIRIKDRDSQQAANQLTGAIEFQSQDATQPTSGVSTAIKAFAASSTGGSYLTISTTDISTSTLDERMRITSEGSVLFGTDNEPNGTSVYGSAFISLSGGRMALKLASSFSGQAELSAFYNTNGKVGSITTSGSATSYNTSSDYRLKEDLKDFAGLDMVSKIPVYDFKWKSDESRSYGVMAHELQEVLPDAVTGEKNAEEMQGVDYSKIVPLLIKSIQELTAKVEKLESENCKCKN